MSQLLFSALGCTDPNAMALLVYGQSRRRWTIKPSHSPPQMVKNSPLVDLNSIVLRIIFVAPLESSDLPSRSSFFKIKIYEYTSFPLSRISSTLAILAAPADHPLSPQRGFDEGASPVHILPVLIGHGSLSSSLAF
eukprot:scaffold21316_cov82-Skeletonema_dohrnii-CCMP3373.AAC.1